MESLNAVITEVVKETRQKFWNDSGMECEEEPEIFIEWYLINCSGPFRILINDISEYYLKIPEEEVLEILKKNRNEKTKIDREAEEVLSGICD